MYPIRVLVAEDQAFFRSAYQSIFEQSEKIDLLEMVINGEEAVEAAKRLEPDVAMLDIKMPKMNGIQAANEIRKLFPKIGVVIFSNYAQRQYAQAFLRDGTAGKAYLLKTTLNEPEELIRAIEVVSERGAILAPEIQDELFKLALEMPNSYLNDLTKREREVLSKVAEGYTNIGIANQLYIAERTVESHVNNIFSKLAPALGASKNPRVMAVLLFLQSMD
ncbi:MAG: hypothetical protein B6242_01810 [Anaerolineaceae bacterium 4572_78]|nr:MAG: hypothetical protein B6242_01810 [Anaerolineaceae bacterium 4572_78]